MAEPKLSKTQPQDSQEVVTTHIFYIREDIGEIKNTLKDLKEVSITRAEFTALKEEIRQFEGRVVTRDEFVPVKNVVFGLVALALTALVLAVLANVIVK